MQVYQKAATALRFLKLNKNRKSRILKNKNKNWNYLYASGVRFEGDEENFVKNWRHNAPPIIILK